tara:strand:+ start:1362 stop:2060 length:699 start_codon:yes stop_codon:yes gene_type:complete
MAKADSFTALGKGNGFPICLPIKEMADDEIIFNDPTLKETMDAYWNFKSVTFGGATFEPDNEPKDLICDQTLNVGSDRSGNPGPNENGQFIVSNAVPQIFFDEEKVKYYKHGIKMSFTARTLVEDSSAGERSKSSTIIVNYFSALYTGEENEPYTCVDETFQGHVVGKSASERTQTISSVTISGIPFIKEVIKIFNGTAFRDSDPDDPIPPCPTSDGYPGEPGLPTLNLHTY